MPSSPSPVLSAEQRAWQYWFDDGLPTLVAGVGCLLVAAFLAYDRGPDRIAFFLGGTGLILVLDGALTLFRYLRANPRSTQTSREDPRVADSPS